MTSAIRELATAMTALAHAIEYTDDADSALIERLEAAASSAFSRAISER